MAGDWIKLEAVTPDKPEMYAIAGALNCSHGEAFLGCVRFWIWADQQSRFGHDLGVTKKTIDHVSGVTGMADAMLSVGWLVDKNSVLSVPNFDRHNGKTAKERALAAKRKQAERSRSERDNSVTREEKRRSKNKDESPPNGGSTVWDFGKSLLAEQGLSTKSAGALIGSWLREWDEPTVAEALRAAAGKADIKAYVAGVLKNKPKRSSEPKEPQVAL